VLLRNEAVGGRPCLPLDEPGSTLAVIGPNAHREIAGGGGSARLTPTGVTTVLTGLRTRLGDDRVVYEPGCRNDRGTPAIDGVHARRADGSRGVDVDVLDGDGNVRRELRPSGFQVLLASEPWPGAPAKGWTLRAACTYQPFATGEHRFKLKTNFAARLTVDGAVVLDSARGDTEGAIELVAGEDAAVEVLASPPDGADGVFRYALELRCAPPFPDDALERAVSAARAADAAIVVLGLDGEWETEGRDRDDLSLPGPQVELVRAVAAAQPRTVAVVLAGSPVDLSWVDDVPAVLWGWYPGQAGGDALADVLLGAVDPGGRLPCTFPAALEDTLADPSSRGSGHVPYPEGVFAGHRRYDRDSADPRFPFGHGLSYSTFTLGPPAVSRTMIGPGDGVVVHVDVTNTGDRGGSEVVQLYVLDMEASVPRAERELRGFAKVQLAPGETRTVEIALGPRDLAFWDERDGCWRAEAGTFELIVGRSSRALTGSVTIELTGDWTAPASWWPA
jgi:beta-glucosidase